MGITRVWGTSGRWSQRRPRRLSSAPVTKAPTAAPRPLLTGLSMRGSACRKKVAPNTPAPDAAAAIPPVRSAEPARPRTAGDAARAAGCTAPPGEPVAGADLDAVWLPSISANSRSMSSSPLIPTIMPRLSSSSAWIPARFDLRHAAGDVGPDAHRARGRRGSGPRPSPRAVPLRPFRLTRPRPAGPPSPTTSPAGPTTPPHRLGAPTTITASSPTQP